LEDNKSKNIENEYKCDDISVNISKKYLEYLINNKKYDKDKLIKLFII